MVSNPVSNMEGRITSKSALKLFNIFTAPANTSSEK